MSVELFKVKKYSKATTFFEFLKWIAKRKAGLGNLVNGIIFLIYHQIFSLSFKEVRGNQCGDKEKL